MKNLQYAYSLDLLRFEDAKKHHQYKDSITLSGFFLEPLTHIHFDNSVLFKRYDSYKKLSILKWKKDVENSQDFAMMNDVIGSIRNEALREGVLKSLYETMPKDKILVKEYLKLIKTNTTSQELLFKIKERDKKVRQVTAIRNLSKFDYKNSRGEDVKLTIYKGKYIFVSAWTSVCGDCVEQFKGIKKLKNKFEEKNIVFVGISLDKEEKYADWLGVIQENEIVEDQLFFNESSKSKFINKYEISSIPSFFILSLKGEKMNIKIEDPLSKETKKLLKNLLKKRSNKNE